MEGDGRHLRRQHNRAAVVEALLYLYGQGNLDPSAEEIAERAGLSARSLFRYFDDLGDLCRAAIVAQRQALHALVPLRFDPGATLEYRVVRVVDHRVALFEAMGTVGQVWRLRAPFQPLLAQELTLWRSVLRDVLYDALRVGADPIGHAALAAADALLSFECYQLMRGDQLLSREQTTNALVAAITAIFQQPHS